MKLTGLHEPHFSIVYKYRPIARSTQISTMSTTKFRVERICLGPE